MDAPRVGIMGVGRKRKSDIRPQRSSGRKPAYAQNGTSGRCPTLLCMHSRGQPSVFVATGDEDGGLASARVNTPIRS